MIGRQLALLEGKDNNGSQHNSISRKDIQFSHDMQGGLIFKCLHTCLAKVSRDDLHTL